MLKKTGDQQASGLFYNIINHDLSIIKGYLFIIKDLDFNHITTL